MPDENKPTTPQPQGPPEQTPPARPKPLDGEAEPPPPGTPVGPGKTGGG